ncbi:MAG: hypothetical protein U0414_31005 [Polyangiaceae bacterium]
MAIEPRIGVAIPTSHPSAVGPFFDVSCVMEREWVRVLRRGLVSSFPSPQPGTR